MSDSQDLSPFLAIPCVTEAWMETAPDGEPMYVTRGALKDGTVMFNHGSYDGWGVRIPEDDDGA